MSLYRHILIATDYSAAARQVAEKGFALAKNCGARVSLLHVVEYIPPFDLSSDLVLPEFDLEQEMLENAREHMQDLTKKQAQIHDIDAEAIQNWVELGSPKEEIVRIAAERDADLIVMGSHGTHGLALLLGSTANAVLHHAGCDVLAVRIQDSDQTSH